MSATSLVLPFGTGKRACPGKRLAEQEIHVLVAKLFQAYDVQLLDELYPIHISNALKRAYTHMRIVFEKELDRRTLETL